MRIAYFAHFAGGSDGASAMDADFLAALRAQGHDVTVLSPFAKPETGRVAGDISAARLARLVLAIPGYTRMALAGLRLARDPDRRIVSQYHVFHPATFVAFVVARLRSRPLIVRAHDPLPGSYRGSAQGAMFRGGFRLYRRVLRHPRTWTMVPSRELRAVVGDSLGLSAERVLVVPNNVTPMSLPNPDDVARLRTSLGLEGRRVVLQFGSFTDAGTRTFVEALHLLGRPEVVGLILADPWRTAQFTRLAAASGIADRLIAPGPQPYARLNAFLTLADVCVGILSADPIAIGSMPRSTMEAMAFGKPVVLARDVSSASLVDAGRNCVAVPPGDPASLASAIARILEDPALAAALGSRARETAGKFRSDAVARSFTAALDGIP